MANSSSRPNFFILLFASLVGLAVTILGVVQFKKALETKHWPSVEGTIITSEMSGGTKVAPIVRYLYYVDDQEYSFDQVNPLKLGRGQKKYAQRVLDKYPMDAKVTVYYNPSDPKSAVLEPGTIAGNYWIPLIGLIIFLAPLTNFLPLKKKS